LSGVGAGAELDDEGEVEGLVGLDEVGAGLLVLADELELVGAELLLLGALDEVLGALDEVLGALVALVGDALVGAWLCDGSGWPCSTCGGVSQPRRLFTVTYAGAVVRVLYTETLTAPGAEIREAERST
jgi:hypothetical protein